MYRESERFAMPDKPASTQKAHETIVPEVVFEVKGEKTERELVALLQSSSSSSPNMLGMVLANKGLYDSLCVADPEFAKRAAALILEETDAQVRQNNGIAVLLEQEPENIKIDQAFSSRGQLFAFGLSLFGLSIAALCAWRGSYGNAAWIVGASLASGFIVSLINKAYTPEQQTDGKFAPPQQKNGRK